MRSILLYVSFIILIFSNKSISQRAILSGELKYMFSEVRVVGAQLYIPPFPANRNDVSKTSEVGEFGIPVDTRLFKPGNSVRIIVKVKDSNQTYDFELEETIPDNYTFKKSLYIDKRQARKIVFGTVRDEINKKPISGIKVYLKTDALEKTTSIGSETDIAGSFIINIPKALQLREFNEATFELIDPTSLYLPNSHFADIRSNVDLILKRNPKNIPVDEYSISGLTKVTVKEVRAKEKIIIAAEGSINVGSFVGNSTPEGRSSGVFGFSLASYNIDPSLPHASLMYRLAGGSRWLLCGQGVEITAPTSGPIEILFQINDNTQADNHGAYRVKIKVDN